MLQLLYLSEKWSPRQESAPAGVLVFADRSGRLLGGLPVRGTEIAHVGFRLSPGGLSFAAPFAA